ncbi:MAG: hypothetical protein BYD32DRAFT_403777 [Podila humilis]|nr:MAG: hypothetical protein BYD32DRAFT_403777 [Podila humilis]
MQSNFIISYPFPRSIVFILCFFILLLHLLRCHCCPVLLLLLILVNVLPSSSPSSSSTSCSDSSSQPSTTGLDNPWEAAFIDFSVLPSSQSVWGR